MRFAGKQGMLPSAEARRYIYATLANFLTDDMTNSGGWMLGPLDDEFDQRRVRKEAKKVIAELRRKTTKGAKPKEDA